MEAEHEAGIESSQQSIDNYSESGDGFVITKDQMIPLNDPECKHEFVKDDTEESPHFYAVKCKHCIIGMLIKK